MHKDNRRRQPLLPRWSNSPQASQHAVVKQRIGLTEIEIDYSRPNKNKRDIFGGLVPWDKVWRTGANGATKIKFSDGRDPW